MALPSQAQIVFALVIVKTKPINQAMHEYLAQLRSSIRRQNATSAAGFSATSYWKSECDRLKRLLQHSDATHVATKESGSHALADQTCQALSRKRSRAVLGDSRASKRPRTAGAAATDPSSSGVNGNSKDSMSLGTNVSEEIFTVDAVPPNVEAADLVRRLHIAVQASDTVVTDISTSILLLVQALLGLLDTCVPTAQPSSAAQDLASSSRVPQSAVSPEPLARFIARANVTILQAIDALDLAHDGSVARAQAVHGLLTLFKTNLAQTKNSPFVSASSRPGAAQEDDPAFLVWGRLVAAMFRMLDHNKRQHIELYEGYLYFLLRDLGRDLALTIKDDASANPVEASENTRIDPDQHGFPATATCLLQVLRVAMHNAPRDFRLGPFRTASVTSGTRKTSSAALPANLQASPLLTDAIINRLQRTLVKATFPTIDLFDEGATYFDEPLPPPTITEVAPKKPRRGKSKAKGAGDEVPRDPAEIFRAELWACLGWDILAREGRLADLLRETGQVH